MRRVFGEEKSPWPVNAVVVLTIEQAAPLLSPAYWTSTDETAIRDMWRERRVTLDREFECHIADAGPVRIQGGTAT
jgi:hypothetical protein